MEPLPRYRTRKAIDELAVELNLPNESWMQDWPYEVVVHSDIDRFFAHYKRLLDEDKKFLLMQAIIQAIEEQPTETLFIKLWDKAKTILEKEFTLHEYTIYYWACLDTEDIEDCWRITPVMRELWNEVKCKVSIDSIQI